MKVIVVDGHPVTRTGLKSILGTEEDIKVVGEAGSGEEALRLVAEAVPDLVVLGLNLAGELDGVEVCRQIKTMVDPPYVLILTAYNFAEAMSPSFLAGADSYLHKRSNSEVLLEAVRRTTSGEKVWDVGERAEEPKSIVRIPPDHIRLTSRELEVLELKLRRRTNLEIAGALGISLDTVKPLHLHRAPAGEAGPVVATLDPALTGGSDARGCACVDKRLLQDIQNNPELYYLDAHNAEFPNGAIRGQLA